MPRAFPMPWRALRDLPGIAGQMQGWDDIPGVDSNRRRWMGVGHAPDLLVALASLKALKAAEAARRAEDAARDAALAARFTELAAANSG